MVKFVLTADQTLMSDYRDIPLGSFFSCIPADSIASRVVFNIIKGKSRHKEGRAVFAPYSLRKLEAGLAIKFGKENVVVAHPDHLDKFIGPDTEVVGITVMDPLGLGPVSMSFTNGGVFTSLTKHMFLDLLKKVDKPGRTYKIAVGGPGIWQFDYRPELAEGIDHFIFGEADHVIGDIFLEIMEGHAQTRIEQRGFAPLEQIPGILGAAMEGMVETMRGCGRGCQFCEVTLRKLRYMNHEFIKSEVAINVAAGKKNIHAHSDDIFVYRLQDFREMYPNAEAIKELFKAVMSVPGVRHANPTHGTLAAALADPQLVADVTKIVKGGPNQWIGIQTGLETGSTSLVAKIMPRKLKPYSPEEWREVVMGGLKVFNKNYWYPAMTAIVGLPGETTEDVWDTVSLLDQMDAMEGSRFIVAPLTFVPIGSLKKQAFFNIEESLDEARFNFIYRCWKHIVREVNENFTTSYKASPTTKAMISMVAGLGSGYVMRRLESYGRKRGFEIKEIKSDPIRIRI